MPCVEWDVPYDSGFKLLGLIDKMRREFHGRPDWLEGSGAEFKRRFDKLKREDAFFKKVDEEKLDDFAYGMFEGKCDRFSDVVKKLRQEDYLARGLWGFDFVEKVLKFMSYGCPFDESVFKRIFVGLGLGLELYVFKRRIEDLTNRLKEKKVNSREDLETYFLAKETLLVIEKNTRMEAQKTLFLPIFDEKRFKDADSSK